jgi:hypothetical protein
MDGGVMRRLPGGRASRAGLDPSRLGASEGAELVNSENAATYYLTQAGHHRTGIEAAVGYVDAGFARSRPEQTDDIVSSEFSSIERDWVIETIYQGAYLRQYHLWVACTRFG